MSKLSAQSEAALNLLKTKVAHDANWRVQEMLTKVIDEYLEDGRVAFVYKLIGLKN